MNNLEHILNKLRKLMDLQISAKECGEMGEANAAAAGISRLLAEYDLTLQDIPEEQKNIDPIDIEKIEFTVTYSQHKWYWFLLDTIATHNNCKIIRTRRGGSKRIEDCYYQVIGRKKNREVVLYLISFLTNRFINIGQKRYPEWKLDYIKKRGYTPPTKNVFMKDFLFGCVIGLNEKMEEEKRNLPQEKMNALVVSNQKDIEIFMMDMGVKTVKHRATENNGDVLGEGYKTGRNIDIHQGITQENRKNNLIN